MKFIEGSLINLLVRFLENIKNGCSEKKYILRQSGRKRYESNNLLHKHLLVKN